MHVDVKLTTDYEVCPVIKAAWTLKRIKMEFFNDGSLERLKTSDQLFKVRPQHEQPATGSWMGDGTPTQSDHSGSEAWSSLAESSRSPLLDELTAHIMVGRY